MSTPYLIALLKDSHLVHKGHCILTHKDLFPTPRLLNITTTTTTTMIATATTTPRSPKVTPMAMATSVDKPDDGGAGGAVVAGQVVEFSWKEEGIYKHNDICEGFIYTNLDEHKIIHSTILMSTYKTVCISNVLS